MCRAIVQYRQETSAAQQNDDKAGHDNSKASPPPSSKDPSRRPSQAHHSRQHADPKSHPQQHSDSRSQTRGESEAAENKHVDCTVGVHSTDIDHPDQGLNDEMANTLSMIHTPNAADDQNMTGSHDSSQNQPSAASAAASPEASPQSQDSYVIDMPPSCSASSVHRDSPSPRKIHRQSQPASAKKADVQDLEDMEEGDGRTDSQTEQKRNKASDEEMQHSRKSSRKTLNQDGFFKKDFMLAPSSYACEYDPDIPPDKLADIYTGEESAVTVCI